MSEKFGVAVIGYGGMGGWHVRKLQSMEEIRLCGVYDIDPARNAAAVEAGVHAYSSLEEDRPWDWVAIGSKRLIFEMRA